MIDLEMGRDAIAQVARHLCAQDAGMVPVAASPEMYSGTGNILQVVNITLSEFFNKREDRLSFCRWLFDGFSSQEIESTKDLYYGQALALYRMRNSRALILAVGRYLETKCPTQ